MNPALATASPEGPADRDTAQRAAGKRQPAFGAQASGAGGEGGDLRRDLLDAGLGQHRGVIPRNIVDIQPVRAHSTPALVRVSRVVDSAKQHEAPRIGPGVIAPSSPTRHAQEVRQPEAQWKASPLAEVEVTRACQKHAADVDAAAPQRILLGSSLVRAARIQQDEQRDLLALSEKLMGHRESDQPSEGVPAQEIWSLWLARLHGPNVVRGHLLDRVRRALAIEPMGMQGVEGLVGLHVAGQELDAVNTEEGRPGPVGFVGQGERATNSDHRAPIACARAAMVGELTSVARGMSTWQVSRTRTRSCMASSEWPPRVKKSSWIPTRSIPRISLHRSARRASMSVRGAT